MFIKIYALIWLFLRNILLTLHVNCALSKT